MPRQQPPESEAMELSLPRVVAYLLVPLVLIGGVGMIPTHRIIGPAAWTVVPAAGGIVLAVMLGGAAVVKVRALKGPGPAALTFIWVGLAAAFATLVLGAGAYRLVHLPPKAFFLWLAVLFLPLLIAESIWLGRALRRDAHRLALGEFRRKGQFGS